MNPDNDGDLDLYDDLLSEDPTCQQTSLHPTVNPDDNDGDLDLYDDILVEDLTCKQESLDQVQIKYQEALRRISSLEETGRQNEMEILNLQKKNTYLMKNISVLYKTACTELERRKDVIDMLRNKQGTGTDNKNTQDYRRRGPPPHRYRNPPMFEPPINDNHRFNEGSPGPSDDNGLGPRDSNVPFGEQQDSYSPHCSNYPSIADTVTRNSTPGNQSSYSSLNIPKKERSEKSISQSKSHKSHTSHTTESSCTDSYTPPTQNIDPCDDTRITSSHSAHKKYSDNHTPHTKLTGSSTSHGKHSISRSSSSKRHSESKSSHSKHPRSKSPTSSHCDKQSSSSSKRSHSDSRKHSDNHCSGSRTSEIRSSHSKSLEFEKLSRSSRTSSKDQEPSSSSSSSRSKHKQSQSSEKVDSKSAKISSRSGSCDSKHSDSQKDKHRKRKDSESLSSKDEKTRRSKRKLPEEFSQSSDSKSKRKHKKKSKIEKRSSSQSSELEGHSKSDYDNGEKRANSKGKTLSPGETDNQNENHTEDPNLHDLRNDGMHVSPTTKEKSDQESELKRDQDPSTKMTDSLIRDQPVDTTPESITVSQSLESVTREPEDSAAQKISSATSLSSSHESNAANTSASADGDAEKELAKCEELEIEINAPCSSIQWAGKILSDTDENSGGLEGGGGGGPMPEVDKLKTFTDALSTYQKKAAAHSDHCSDTEVSPEKRSIVIKCKAGDSENSRSPIIIPCYPSKKSKQKHRSGSDSDEECDSDSHEKSTPSKSLIARSLFPLNQATYEKSSETGMDDTNSKVKVKQNIFPTLNNSEIPKNQSFIGSHLSNVATSKPSEKSSKTELNNNEGFASSPILEPESEGLSSPAIIDRIDPSLWQNGDSRISNGGITDDPLSDCNSDYDDNENHNTAEKPSDGNEVNSESELEDGELLSDEENESVPVANAKTTGSKVRSPIRFKSVSPVKCRKSSSSRHGRENGRRIPHREPMKSDAHNRLRSSPERFVSKGHCPSVIGRHSKRKDDRSSRSSGPSSESGSRSQSRRRNVHERLSGIHHRSSSTTERKRRTR